MISTRSSAKLAAFAVLSAVAVFVVGCAHADQETSIAPLAPAAGRVDPGLGPGTRALSSGPGYKGSPSWSPDGGRIAFTVDGYVVDRPSGPGELKRWTTRDFAASKIEWTSDDTLTMLGAASTSGRNTSISLYRAGSREDLLQLERVASGVLAMGQDPGGEGLIYAFGREPDESGLALMGDGGKTYRRYANATEGRVTALSLSPDGDEAALAVRPIGDPNASRLHIFDLRKRERREIARLDGEREILGMPQWTRQGLYFVAGKLNTSADGDGSEPLYNLYRVPAGGGEPELAPGVGEDFVAASIRVSPDGNRLAIIGRLNPKSPANLYVLDPASENLEAVTANEDMEIMTGPDDLVWSPDGKSVVIVARGTPSTEPEVRADHAERLLRDFYNLYEIPVPEATPQ